MTDQPTPKDTSNRDMAIRSTAIDMAIRSNCGHSYDAESRLIVEAEKIIEGAKLFESYIKGEVISTVLTKKENW